MARARTGCLAVVVTVALLVGGVTIGVKTLQGDSPPPAARCSAELDGTRWGLDPEQASNAATIAGIALQRGLPARAVTIALATALQESALRNLDYGDRDSLGLFQQRPSQGWGTPEQVTDPVYAAGAFFDALVKVDGWEDMEVTVAAQTVQRSAFPDAYAQHETKARAWASALTGWSPATILCTNLPESTAPADGSAVAALAAQDLGSLATWTPGPAGSGTLTTSGADAQRLAWAAAQWAVATASVTGVRAVGIEAKEWTGKEWEDTDTPANAGEVTVAPAAP